MRVVYADTEYPPNVDESKDSLVVNRTTRAATLVGPYTENFRPVMADLLAAQALIQVDSAEALERDVERLVRDASARKKLGEAGVQAVERRKGVVANVAATLNQVLGAAARL